jgi:transcriptional regulator with XRE-family HTH domain
MLIPVNGEVVRQMRKERGLSQLELADIVKVSENTIWKAENKRPLSRKVIEDIARGFHSLDPEGEDTVVELTAKLVNDVSYRPAIASEITTRNKPFQKGFTSSKRALKEMGGLKAMQCDVIAPDFVLDDSTLATLVELEDKFWNADEESGRYASLIVGYALLKAGPEISRKYRSRFNKLSRVVEERTPESMAAKWIVARALLSWTSLLPDPEQRYRETKRAYDLFALIAPVSADELRMEVLLPGSKQEYDPEQLIHIDPTYGNDPLVRAIILPHRYMSAAAVALAEQMTSERENHLRAALRHCNEVEKYVPGESAPRLNADLLRLDALALRYNNAGRRDRQQRELLSTANGLIKRIQRAETQYVVSSQKANEWIANCHACLIVAKRYGHECGEQIEELVRRLKILAAGTGGVPDFLNIDPIYRLAIDIEIPGQMEDVLAELRRAYEISTKR